MDEQELFELLKQNPELRIDTSTTMDQRLKELADIVEGRKTVAATTGKKKRPRKKTTIRPKEADDVTELLLGQIKMAGLPAPVLEFVYHPIRKWRFDLAWPKQKLAFEIEGGIHLKTSGGYSGGHAHPKRFVSDIHKYNNAWLEGWGLLRATPQMVRNGQAITYIMRYFEKEERWQ